MINVEAHAAHCRVASIILTRTINTMIRRYKNHQYYDKKIHEKDDLGPHDLFPKKKKKNTGSGSGSSKSEEFFGIHRASCAPQLNFPQLVGARKMCVFAYGIYICFCILQEFAPGRET